MASKKVSKDIQEAMKLGLLSELKYYDQKIAEIKKAEQLKENNNVNIYFYPELELTVNVDTPVDELKRKEESMKTCLLATQELTRLIVLQHEVNILVGDRVVEGDSPVPIKGVWKQVTADCRIDMIPFCISFFAHKDKSLFGPILYSGLEVTLVKVAHEFELKNSILPILTKPADVTELIRSYAIAYRSRRSSLEKLLDRFTNTLVLDRLHDGGYQLSCPNLKVSWTLQYRLALDAPFKHQLTIDLDEMDESYITLIRHNHEQLCVPHIKTDERTFLLTNIITACIEAQNSAKEFQESVVSDAESATQRRDVDIPAVESNLMAPPKSLPKKSRSKHNNKRPSDNADPEPKKFKKVDGNQNTIKVGNSKDETHKSINKAAPSNKCKTEKQQIANVDNPKGNKNPEAKKVNKVDGNQNTIKVDNSKGETHKSINKAGQSNKSKTEKQQIANVHKPKEDKNPDNITKDTKQKNMQTDATLLKTQTASSVKVFYGIEKQDTRVVKKSNLEKHDPTKKGLGKENKGDKLRENANNTKLLQKDITNHPVKIIVTKYPSEENNKCNDEKKSKISEIDKSENKSQLNQNATASTKSKTGPKDVNSGLKHISTIENNKLKGKSKKDIHTDKNSTTKQKSTNNNRNTDIIKNTGTKENYKGNTKLKQGPSGTSNLKQNSNSDNQLIDPKVRTEVKSNQKIHQNIIKATKPKLDERRKIGAQKSTEGLNTEKKVNGRQQKNQLTKNIRTDNQEKVIGPDKVICKQRQ
ncbi:putative uncharacterized protein DDB_G0277255 isoform X2 [Leptidea sinapis]|uniref:putative uncharacterized protein DDB_G0277255 isoform X2 n=1 Tax=Leptidea sinapis TaxID=189913 RepID=UPI0021C4ACD1|nr:putative uncharacterized protein DDB_G0277255 isoform X2 [Leptidea sinapis]